MPTYYFSGERTYLKNGEPISKEVWLAEAYEGQVDPYNNDPPNPPPRPEYTTRVEAIPIKADSLDEAWKIYERDYAHLYYPQSQDRQDSN